MNHASSDSLILYAPNVHQGGGLVLLNELLSTHSLAPRVAVLDYRAHSKFPSVLAHTLYWVKRTFLSRLWAEFALRRMAKPTDTILCFNGLPPLFRLQGKVVVFIQNKLLIDASDLAAYPLKVRLRIAAERLWLRMLMRNITRIIVQTTTMANALAKRNTLGLPISILPFYKSPGSASHKVKNVATDKFDFIYVASGEPHKNHLVLLDAWHLLAQDGYRPSLALTLDSTGYADLIKRIADLSRTHHLNIQNLGSMDHSQIMSLYRHSGALIYPSFTESFGLPLIEAADVGMPILAPELDYVRDIVQPTVTFDAHSAVSIARAVRRFLGNSQRPAKIGDGHAFMQEVLKKTE